MALGEPLNAAGQSVTLSGGNIQFDGAAIDGHKTLADAGAVDGSEYHIELSGSEGWELLRITYTSGSPDSAARPAPLASSNGGSAVSFSGGVEARYVLPGIKSELAELLNTSPEAGSVAVINRAAQTGSFNNDGSLVTLDGNPVGSNRTFVDAGMIRPGITEIVTPLFSKDAGGVFQKATAGQPYHIELSQDSLWELHVSEAITAEATPVISRGTPVDSSNSGSPVNFDLQASVNVMCLPPGIKAQLQSIVT